MSVILDTCALLWLVADDPLLSGKARRLIEANRDTIFVSAISAFEIAVKYHKGKLTLCGTAENWWQRSIAHHGLSVVDVTDSIFLTSAALPLLHHDPCDRIIVATAEDISATILTPDHLIAQYPSAKVEW